MSRRERQRRRSRNKGGPARPVFLALGVLTTLAALAVLGAVGWVVSVATSGPELSSLKPQDQGAASVVYAADGTRLGFITTDILRTPITGTQIPQVMRDATVAIEDRRFFDHKGVDFEGVVRAAVKNLESKNDVQGGSTLTMQLIRNLYTKNTTRSGIEGYKRKIREAKLAEEFENLHPGRKGKRYILDQYLNNVPYGTVGGKTAVGVQAAARIFFNKSASELTLSQAALLAGLPQAPSLYNPFLDRARATQRRNDVLRAMAGQGYITQDQAAKAIATKIDVKDNGYYSKRRESYFFDYVRQQLIDEYGVDKVRAGGMHIYTTLDLKMQTAARKSIDTALAGTDRSGAIVSVDPRNGEIKAMASNAQYGQFKFNLASQGHYAAGSTFKVMVLMTALRMGVDPDTTTYTSMPLKFNDPKWGPIDVHTYSGTYIGRANLVRATLQSDNSIYEQLDLDVGPENVKQTAIDMGIKTHLDGYPAEGLGGLTKGVTPLEMANAYATIASGGWRNRVTAVRKVCFPKAVNAVSGFTCTQEKIHRHKAFEDGVTAKATEILKKNVEAGTGTKAQYGCPAAGKTGTVDDFTDAWFVGFTPRLSTAVWVGHATDRRTLGAGAAGGEVAAPIWGAYMKTAHGSYCGDFAAPKVPFKSTPFFGKYAKTGVQGNQVDPSTYQTDANGGQSLETGKKGKTGAKDGKGTGNGSTKYPPDAYANPPQGTPTTQAPAATPTTPATGTPAPTPTPAPAPSTGAGGGTAPPP
ncbi:glycosyl transferase [Baekduia soli]|uniref:Glycosyl transferase n=1 Tax=Baekduia soli TaxID=496014 RepID=A0A5B8U117_9ACTN|nr:transglycosylase domain-containing protein [Baekduia soli]QEC46719.1 glycosyl transferase [Baekduia soli]